MRMWRRRCEEEGQAGADIRRVGLRWTTKRKLSIYRAKQNGYSSMYDTFLTARFAPARLARMPGPAQDRDGPIFQYSHRLHGLMQPLFVGSISTRLPCVLDYI